MLQCVAVCVLQSVAVWCRGLTVENFYLIGGVAACSSVCVAVSCSVLHRAKFEDFLPGRRCCSLLQFAAVFVLQCDAACCRELKFEEFLPDRRSVF